MKHLQVHRLNPGQVVQLSPAESPVPTVLHIHFPSMRSSVSDEVHAATSMDLYHQPAHRVFFAYLKQRWTLLCFSYSGFKFQFADFCLLSGLRNFVFRVAPIHSFSLALHQQGGVASGGETRPIAGGFRVYAFPDADSFSW